MGVFSLPNRVMSQLLESGSPVSVCYRGTAMRVYWWRRTRRPDSRANRRRTRSGFQSVLLRIFRILPGIRVRYSIYWGRASDLNLNRHKEHLSNDPAT